MIPSLAACAVAAERETGSAAIYAIVDDTDVIITSSNGGPGTRSTHKEHVKGIVHRIPNDFLIADSARATIVSSQCRLSL
jgi:hypothetical protein